jgi:hypothetical protein
MLTLWSGFKYQLDESTSLVWNSSSALKPAAVSVAATGGCNPFSFVLEVWVYEMPRHLSRASIVEAFQHASHLSCLGSVQQHRLYDC